MSVNIEELDRISDRNLVLFFAEELRQIDAGERARDIFSYRKIQSLVKHGILRLVKGREKRKKGHTLTDKARNLLKIDSNR